ncbi:MAG: LacI family DNA-binding transcriptional regulator [Anaerolineaceae bacterium]|nr:LacI family DNA-binding transcriptional regulator [Anaerolineaceae bacterium]
MAKTTIKDVAQKAGVSTATVSRVLRKKGPISEKTGQMVLQAARDLQFSVSTPGWRSPSGTHRNLGMLIAGVENGLQQNSFFAEVVAGATIEGDRRNLTISIAPLSTDILAQPMMLRQGRVDGLIVAGVPIPDEQVMVLSQAPVPTVFIGRYLDHYPLSYVSPENLEGGRMAALYLKDLGHCNVAILSGPASIKTFNDRLRGVQEVFRDCELPVFLRDSFDEVAGYESVSSLIQSSKPFTAVLSLSDWMAFGALRALREHGLRVPEDVSVIGFSDLPTAEINDPPLTTIHIPQRQLGALAVHLAHALIEGEILAPVGMIVPLSLAQRASTAPARELTHA